MKKKIFSFILALTMILPFGFTLVGCGDKHECTASTEWSSDDTHHWKACSDSTCSETLEYGEHDFAIVTEPATLDADGLETKTCNTCGKVITTVLEMLTQNTDEQIAVLTNAVKPENYTGNLLETIVYKTNSKDRVTSISTPITDTEYLARLENGNVVSYSMSSDKPASFLKDEYIYDAEYIEKVEDKNIYYSLEVDDDENPTALELIHCNYVGNNYANSYCTNSIKNSHDYLLNISNTSTLSTTLIETMTYYVNIYKNIFSSNYGDNFSYSTDDIEFDYEVNYSQGTYTATGIIVLDTLTHENALPAKKMESFKVEFEVIYTNNLVVRNYSKFSYIVDNTPAISLDDLTEIYNITDITYSHEISNLHFERIKTIIDEFGEQEPIPFLETIRFHVNGQHYTNTTVPFGTAINTKVHDIVDDEFISKGFDNYSTINLFIDKDCTIPYDPNTDIIISDFYGTDIYIVITPNENYSLVLTSYTIYFSDIAYEYELVVAAELVLTNQEYSIDLAGINPHYDENVPGSPLTIDYDDKIIVNGETTTETTLTPTLKEYHINLYYITTYM